MITDLHGADSDRFDGRSFDVCICGAGIAGIALALSLSERLEVALLEAGGYEPTEESQEVYSGRSIGRQYFDLKTTRLRYFGGTSNNWGGWCRALDSYDFEPKPWANMSGWPIQKSDLDPYLEHAQSILDINPDDGKGKVAESRALALAMDKSNDLDAIDFWWSRPTRFAEKYANSLRQARNISCFLNANVVDMALFDDLSRVRELEVRTYTGRIFKVRARSFVLAAGGIENPRILLNCNSQRKEGLGNEHGLVGRFFADHPHHKVGEFLLQDKIREVFAKLRLGPQDRMKHVYRYFAPSKQLMSREKILNFGLRFEPYIGFSDSFKESFRFRLRRAVCGFGLVEAAVEGIMGREIPCGDGILRVASEPAPNPSSRIILDRDVDRFGKRRIALDWRLSDIDKRTIRIAATRFGMALANRDLGRLRVADWLVARDADIELPGLGADDLGGHHHMCTTRMGRTPRDGVVDPNQRVFGIDNLYVAGSSVFAATGHANPTFPMVQLTLRLAKHLNQVLKRQA
jgi:choline dehydrogenase-like flavoprotein